MAIDRSFWFQLLFSEKMLDLLLDMLDSSFVSLETQAECAQTLRHAFSFDPVVLETISKGYLPTLVQMYQQQGSLVRSKLHFCLSRCLNTPQLCQCMVEMNGYECILGPLFEQSFLEAEPDPQFPLVPQVLTEYLELQGHMTVNVCDRLLQLWDYAGRHLTGDEEQQAAAQLLKEKVAISLCLGLGSHVKQDVLWTCLLASLKSIKVQASAARVIQILGFQKVMERKPSSMSYFGLLSALQDPNPTVCITDPVIVDIYLEEFCGSSQEDRACFLNILPFYKPCFKVILWKDINLMFD
jgi:hypothetical protein